MEIPKPDTKEYFYWEVSNLRNMWGTKTFWKNMDNALTAFGAVLFIYFNLPDNEMNDAVINTMKAIQLEFGMRVGYTDKLNMKLVTEE
ncbi:MAG: hypothetical protein WC346_02910 [Methanogenium sp.]|jgi:hypothetical protein